MTLDGYCDHTSAIADEATHQHYTELIRSGDTLLYGRITYALMENYWPYLLENPSGNKELDDFALAIDAINKIVYSTKLQRVNWGDTQLKNELNLDEIRQLKNQKGGNILVGSRSLIIALLENQMIDEFQIAIHPIIAGSGLMLFDKITKSINFKLASTKTFKCGVVVLYYEPIYQYFKEH